MAELSRRTFLKNTTATIGTTAALSLWGAKPGWAGANDRIRVGVIGIRGMGQNHIKNYNELPNVEVAAICDVDENLFPERVQKHFTDKGLKKPQLYTDLRKLLENKDIDAVSIVTPNHWHTLAAIWAMQAGKHVSVEKPCCHDIYEGKKLVEAAKKYGLVVQDGAEQRSNPCSQSAMEFLHSGGLGEVYMAKGICYKWRNTIGKTPDEPVPAGVNYDLWLGPAAKRPFSKNRFHYNWHWNWEYGNGDMGNQGIHEMDIARWGLNVTLPEKVFAMGGHYMFDDDQNTPNTLMAVFEFPNEKGSGDKRKMLQFETRHWITNREGVIDKDPASTLDYMVSSANTVGNIFYGSEGFMVKTVNEWKTFMGKEREPGPSGGGLGNHYANYIDAIRANDPKALNGSILDGHHTCSLVHLANTSYRLGRSLEYDPEKEVFIGDDDANAMMKRKYREPFVVPEKV